MNAQKATVMRLAQQKFVFSSFLHKSNCTVTARVENLQHVCCQMCYFHHYICETWEEKRIILATVQSSSQTFNHLQCCNTIYSLCSIVLIWKRIRAKHWPTHKLMTNRIKKSTILLGCTIGTLRILRVNVRLTTFLYICVHFYTSLSLCEFLFGGNFCYNRYKQMKYFGNMHEWILK